MRNIYRITTVIGFAGIAGACGGTGSTVRSYVDRLGDDTLAVETFERTADGYRGMLLTRNPVTRLAKYEAHLNADGTVSSFEVGWSIPTENPDGGPGPHMVVTFDGDSATIERHAPDGGSTSRVGAPHGTIPMVGKAPYSYAVLEQAFNQGRTSEQESFAVTVLNLNRAATQEVTFNAQDPELFTYSFFGSPMRVMPDASGSITAISGVQTTMKVEGTPADSADVEALAGEFAAMDARGEGLGVPSPAGEASATISGARLTVAYSRPAKRGREIFGGLVPYGEAWRTGANAATSFSTTRDLVLGGETLPAGDYTFFSIYTADTAILIVNGQTGQWGTTYDEAEDVMRVPMVRDDLAEISEKFTISFEETDGGGVIVLEWDESRFSVPFSIN